MWNSDTEGKIPQDLAGQVTVTGAYVVAWLQNVTKSATHFRFCLNLHFIKCFMYNKLMPQWTRFICLTYFVNSFFTSPWKPLLKVFRQLVSRLHSGSGHDGRSRRNSCSLKVRLFSYITTRFVYDFNFGKVSFLLLSFVNRQWTSLS